MEEIIIKDSNGNILKEGDTVMAIKDLKVKGSSGVVKRGTKATNIRLCSDGRHIESSAKEVKGLMLDASFLKKV
ncbi:MAG: alkylphosphonate utilization protein [Alphaproteobacteria bacterium]|nr:MAG: alkylphosphonate utilization protein [Alphaproteobacteria bacterium]